MSQQAARFYGKSIYRTSGWEAPHRTRDPSLQVGPRSLFIFLLELVMVRALEERGEGGGGVAIGEGW